MVPGTEEYRAYQREWRRKQTPEKQAAALATARAWKAQNPERVKEMRKKYHAENKVHCNAYGREWRAKNAEQYRELKRISDTRYRKENIAKIKAYKSSPEFKAARNERERERYHSDPNYRAEKVLRAGLTQALRLHGDGRRTNAVKDLIGCTISEFVAHIQAQLEPGMTLFNTHIDHIRPCASFDLTDPKQQRECFHFSNLRPMWPIDNIKKGAKW